MVTVPRRFAATSRLVALTGSAAVLLTGCSFLEQEPTEPTVVESEEPAIVDDVTTVLEPLLGDAESLPTSEELFDVLLDAGYDEDQIESTQDDTPLATGVSSKMFAVLVDEGCIVGEIREGDVFARLMPPSESTGTCLYGAVDRPEGAAEPSGEPREDGADDNGAGHIPGEDFSRPSEDGEADNGTGGEGSGDTSDGGGSDGDSGDSGDDPGDAGLGGN